MMCPGRGAPFTGARLLKGDSMSIIGLIITLVVICEVLWLLSVFGVFSMNLGTVPRVTH